jgi:hypothetical protein
VPRRKTAAGVAVKSNKIEGDANTPLRKGKAQKTKTSLSVKRQAPKSRRYTA